MILSSELTNAGHPNCSLVNRHFGLHKPALLLRMLHSTVLFLVASARYQQLDNVFDS